MLFRSRRLRRGTEILLALTRSRTVRRSGNCGLNGLPAGRNLLAATEARFLASFPISPLDTMHARTSLSRLFRPATAGLLFGLAALAPAQTAPASAGATPRRDDQAVQLTAFTVSEAQDIGYESMQTTSGMRTVQELKNLANSISDRKSTRLNSSHVSESRMPSSA